MDLYYYDIEKRDYSKQIVNIVNISDIDNIKKGDSKNYGTFKI